MSPSAPKSRSASGRALVAPPSLCGLRAIASAAASGRGRDQSEGPAAFSGMLDSAVSRPVIVVGEAAIILLIFGFPQ